MDLHTGQALLETDKVMALTLGFPFRVERFTAEIEYCFKSAWQVGQRLSSSFALELHLEQICTRYLPYPFMKFYLKCCNKSNTKLATRIMPLQHSVNYGDDEAVY